MAGEGVRAAEINLGAVAFRAGDLVGAGRVQHDHGDGNVQRLAGEGEALGEVAGRCQNHALGLLFRRQVMHHIERGTHFERPCDLQILALQEQGFPADLGRIPDGVGHVGARGADGVKRDQAVTGKQGTFHGGATPLCRAGLART